LAESDDRPPDAPAGRRLAREPPSRILGAPDPPRRPFPIGPASLDPRPDTETLVDRALGFAAAQKAPSILDLGTGSSAILVTLLAELPGARGTGTDVSAAALAVAGANARRHGVAGRAHFVAADWCDGVTGRFDLIVSNPPYIPSGDMIGLEPEVRDHDPVLALDGGTDGLDAYRAIAAGAGARLSPGGLMALEIGAGQQDAVAELFVADGWRPALGEAASLDLSGRIRVLAFTR
jgi:release factor glutamine methyltransferase